MDPEELPPELDQGAVPFEPALRRFARTRNLVRRVTRKRKKPPSASAVAISAAVFFGGGLGVQYFDQGSLLFAWLMAGPLALTVYLTYEGRGSLFNPYTLFFAVLTVASVAAHLILA